MTEIAKSIVLHPLERFGEWFKCTGKEFEIDPATIYDAEWLTYAGGTTLYTTEGKFVVDENPNNISLLAGFIEEPQCATGSYTGMHSYKPKDKL